MSTVQSNNLEKLVTLKEAAEKLGVTIETLLSWNEHNILKPTINQTGEIGYAPQQIDQFLIIRQLTQTAPQMQIKPVEPTSIADVYLKSEMRVASQTSKHTRPSYRLIFSFVALAVLLTIGVFTQQEGLKALFGQQQKLADNGDKVLGVQTSKLTLPKKIISDLPIALNNDGTNKKDLHDEGEDVSEKKIAAPALYKVKTQNTIAVNRQSQIPVMTAMRPQTDETNSKSGNDSINDTGLDNTYSSTAFFQDTCTSCKADKDSAIDERGNIRGDAKPDTLATVVGGFGGMVEGDSLKQTNSDATNQLLFFFIGAIAVMYITQQQFAYSRTKSQIAIDDAYKNREDLGLQKILEVDQKTDGTVVLYFQGREYKISKPELYSESDRFIEKMMALVQPDMKEIEYDVLRQVDGKFVTPLSRLVTRLGFVGIKRDLFFPRTSKHRVLFRRYLTHQDLIDMNLTTTEILNDLTSTS